MVEKLTKNEVEGLTKKLTSWKLSEDHLAIEREIQFYRRATPLILQEKIGSLSEF